MEAPHLPAHHWSVVSGVGPLPRRSPVLTHRGGSTPSSCRAGDHRGAVATRDILTEGMLIRDGYRHRPEPPRVDPPVWLQSPPDAGPRRGVIEPIADQGAAWQSRLHQSARCLQLLAARPGATHCVGPAGRRLVQARQSGRRGRGRAPQRDARKRLFRRGPGAIAAGDGLCARARRRPRIVVW